MEVQIISKEFIKPSSPTPNHLRTYKASILDQISPSGYVPIVLFYNPIHDNHHDLDLVAIEKRSLLLLKKSLSKTLSRFYPLAGRVKGNFSIDCNDDGAYYVEARVKCLMSEFLNKPDFSLIHQFLPSDDISIESSGGGYVAMVQVNTFDCGGIAIGLIILHMIMDGIALSTFCKDWAAIAKKGNCDDDDDDDVDDNALNCPDFVTAPSLYPQNDSLPKELYIMNMWYPFFKTGNAVIRRFVFDASALAALKAKASKSSSSLVQNPTRVQVVSALIWKCAMAAFKATSGGVQNSCLLTHVVNLRRKALPPFSEYLMGNITSPAVAQFTAETESSETKTELGFLVQEVREAITKVNGELLKTQEDDQGFYKFCEALREIGGGAFSSAASSDKKVDYIGFSSWCNFGIYEADFGWGKPVWVTSTGTRQASILLNFVILTETRRGDGIEACITLVEQDMAILECDKELLAFASLDPSPLQ